MAELVNEPQENLFDVVVPIGPNDVKKVMDQMNYTKKNIVGYRNIYIVCYDPSVKIEGCISINENTFPFTIKTVVEKHGKSWRNGWYLQQLIKLYSGIAIPGILDRYLILDSDTFFMKPTKFIEDNKCCYNYGVQNWGAYFHHMAQLHPSLKRVEKKQSGICHHMMFETSKVKQLFELVENHHNNKPFYEVFLDCVPKKFHSNGSGASEYELYYNYLLTYHKDDIIVRKLKWKDSKNYDKNLDYVSIHWHFSVNSPEERQRKIDESVKLRENLKKNSNS